MQTIERKLAKMKRKVLNSIMDMEEKHDLTSITVVGIDDEVEESGNTKRPAMSRRCVQPRCHAASALRVLPPPLTPQHTPRATLRPQNVSNCVHRHAGYGTGEAAHDPYYAQLWPAQGTPCRVDGQAHQLRVAQERPRKDEAAYQHVTYVLLAPAARVLHSLTLPPPLRLAPSAYVVQRKRACTSSLSAIRARCRGRGGRFLPSSRTWPKTPPHGTP